ncbi:hypothetical protein [Aeromonas veronii]|uniref:hypothetical protein n=1 Tax=Aeromonas veronii TaxID=654 RepID=UPI0038EC2E22
MDITAIASLISVLVAIAAAWFSWISANAWKESSIHAIRTKAMSDWIGMAAFFRGTLKPFDKRTLRWPEDKDAIEYVSEKYWSWVALWPSVKASLEDDLKKQATDLWDNSHEAYNSLMDGECTVEQFALMVEAIYNSDLLERVIKKHEKPTK